MTSHENNPSALPHWLAETITMQEKVGEPLTDADVDMFLMFEREGLSHEQRMRHICGRRLEDLHCGGSLFDRLKEGAMADESEFTPMSKEDFLSEFKEKRNEQETLRKDLYERVKDSEGRIGHMSKEEFFEYLDLLERFRHGFERSENSFDPEKLGFVFLWDHHPPNGPDYYEYKNHSSVDGRENGQRLNVYLSLSGEYACIWHGVLDTMLIDILAEKQGVEIDDWDMFEEQYFRGYIKDEAHAKQVLRAFRLPEKPQEVTFDPDKGVVCDWMEE